MALTLVARPAQMAPVNSPIVFAVTSDNKYENSFRYLCDLYVEGVLTTQLSLKPTGDSGFGVFPVNKILEDFLSFDLHVNLVGFLTNANSVKKYHIVFTEEFDATTEDEAPTPGDTLTTDDYFVWNGSWQHGELQDVVDGYATGSERFSEYSPSLPYTSGYLLSMWQPLFPGQETEAELPRYCGLGMPMRIQDVGWANILVSSSTGYEKLLVNTFDADGTKLATYRLDNIFYEADITESQNRMQSFPVAPKSINEVNWNSVTSYESVPNYPVWERVAYYTFALWDGDDIKSQVYRVEVDRTPSKFDGRRLGWLNRYGGFDFFTFGMRSRRTVDVQRTLYSKFPQSIIGSTSWGEDGWKYDRSYRGTSVSSVSATDRHSLTTGWMTSPLAAYLEDLYLSAEVYDIECEKPRCWSSTSSNLGFLRLHFNEPHGFRSGALRVDKCDWSTHFSYITRDVSIADASNPYSVLTSLPYGGASVGETGTALTDNYQDKFTPVVVTDTSYEQKQSASDRLFNYTVNVTAAHKRNVQRS